MKISKLFHWLYAILMLLPFLVFLPNAFYYGFNEHAVAQEKTEQMPVYYESNNIRQPSDLLVGNAYYWNDDFTSLNPPSNTLYLVNVLNNDYFISIANRDISSYYYVSLGINTNGKLTLRYDNGDLYFAELSNRKFSFVVTEILNPNQEFIDNLSPYYTYLKNTEIIETTMSITDSMSYAWDSVWQNDLFSWSYGSFLTEPFIYIGNVFNVPVDNSLYYALSYWLDISIIWLCFDVIMYVPLLVHRWLDKGIVE